MQTIHSAPAFAGLNPPEPHDRLLYRDPERPMGYVRFLHSSLGLLPGRFRIRDDSGEVCVVEAAPDHDFGPFRHFRVLARPDREIARYGKAKARVARARAVSPLAADDGLQQALAAMRQAKDAVDVLPLWERPA